jgi:hypothetical protein
MVGVCKIRFVADSDGKFPEIFTGATFSGNFPYDVRASFFTCLFFTVYYLGFGIFLPYYLCVYSIIYVSGNFPEHFRKFSSLVGDEERALVKLGERIKKT